MGLGETGGNGKLGFGAVAAGVVLVIVALGAAGYGWWEANLRSADQRSVAEQDFDLLVGMFQKLADVSDDKALSTGIQAFESIRDIFDSLVNLSGVAQQDDLLCLNATSRDAFRSRPNLTNSYDRVCAAFGPFTNATMADLPAYQQVFNRLVLALVQLDNAIVADP